MWNDYVVYNCVRKTKKCLNYIIYVPVYGLILISLQYVGN